MTVSESLRALDERSWDEQLREYERLERRERTRGGSSPLPPEFLRDDAGHPLGAGMPTGATIRDDGESHREAWASVCRADPCVYCGRRPGGLAEATVDHVEPKSRPVRGLGGAHSWLNFAGACSRCNGKKGSHVSMLEYLYRRRWHRTWTLPDKEVIGGLRPAA